MHLLNYSFHIFITGYLDLLDGIIFYSIQKRLRNWYLKPFMSTKKRGLLDVQGYIILAYTVWTIHEGTKRSPKKVLACLIKKALPKEMPSLTVQTFFYSMIIIFWIIVAFEIRILLMFIWKSLKNLIRQKIFLLKIIWSVFVWTCLRLVVKQ